MKNLKLVWLGRVWYWGINTKTLKESGCRHEMDDRKWFDIHAESPAFNITDMCHVSVMLNVRGTLPAPPELEIAKQLHGRMNPTPLYEKLSDIMFPLRSMLYMETDDYSKIEMDDCVYKHYWDSEKGNVTGPKIQIVPNKIDMMHIGYRDGLKDILSRKILGGP